MYERNKIQAGNEAGDEYTKVCYTILIFMSDILVGAMRGMQNATHFTMLFNSLIET